MVKSCLGVCVCVCVCVGGGGGGGGGEREREQETKILEWPYRNVGFLQSFPTCVKFASPEALN